MLKSLPLTAVLTATPILLMNASSFTLASTAKLKHPVAFPSDVDTLVCYMKTQDGRTLNLNRLCEKRQVVRIAIVDISKEGNYIMGQVTNNTNKTVYQSQLNFNILDEEDKVVAQRIAYIQPQVLSPGQTGKFEIFRPSNYEVQLTLAEGFEKP